LDLNPVLSSPHFHIRWEENPTLDWECFATYSEAANRARELAAPNEQFLIEEVHAECPLLRERLTPEGRAKYADNSR
jgi:hypothetical protein